MCVICLSTDLIQGKCYPNIFPYCQNINYKYTVIPQYLQKHMYEFVYNKNFTGDSVIDAQFTNTSIIYRYDEEIKKFPKCSKMLKMVMCAERLPPCFLGETSTLYSICESVCQSIYKTCPGVKDSFFKWYLQECEVLPPGNTSHGYCKHTKWPNPHDWLNQEKYFGSMFTFDSSFEFNCSLVYRLVDINRLIDWSIYAGDWLAYIISRLIGLLDDIARFISWSI